MNSNEPFKARHDSKIFDSYLLLEKNGNIIIISEYIREQYRIFLKVLLALKKKKRITRNYILLKKRNFFNFYI